MGQVGPKNERMKEKKEEEKERWINAKKTYPQTKSVRWICAHISNGADPGRGPWEPMPGLACEAPASLDCCKFQCCQNQPGWAIGTGPLHLFTRNVWASSEVVHNSCQVDFTNCQILRAFFKDYSYVFGWGVLLIVFMCMGNKVTWLNWRTRDPKVGRMW